MKLSWQNRLQYLYNRKEVVAERNVAEWSWESSMDLLSDIYTGRGYIDAMLMDVRCRFDNSCRSGESF